jgi:hypothetical protein
VLQITNTYFIPQVLFMNYSMYTPAIESSLLNVTVFTFQTIHSTEVYVSMFAPEFKGDKHFQALILRTRVDVSSIMNNPGTFFMYKPFLDFVLSCLDFELKFPLVKVSESILCSSILSILILSKSFKGIYGCKNFSLGSIMNFHYTNNYRVILEIKGKVEVKKTKKVLLRIQIDASYR